jgi:hypothetical protein
MEIPGQFRVEINSLATDTRLHYAGATIATMLGVDDATAERLGLEQIISRELRRKRKAARRTQKGKEDGKLTREEWLAQNSASKSEPWRALGMARSTWYARGKPVPPVP